MQRAIFIRDLLWVSAGRNSSNHTQYNQNAVDFQGGSRQIVKAPYDCRVVFDTNTIGCHEVGFESKEEVIAPNGTRSKQWMILLHDNDFTSRYGREYRQGEHCYTTGTYMDYSHSGCGDHVHVQCGFGNCPSGYVTTAGNDIETCLFVPHSVQINGNGWGYNWVRGDPIDEVPEAEWQKAIEQRDAAERRWNRARDRINIAQGQLPVKQGEYNTNLALQRAAEERVRSLEPLAESGHRKGIRRDRLHFFLNNRRILLWHLLTKPTI